jgi:hypothetical protein
VRRAAADAFEQPEPEPSRHPLARRQLRVLLAERPPTAPAVVAALAPYQIGDPPGDRQIAHPHHRSLLDSDRRATAIGAATGTGDQLDLEVEPVAQLNHALHLEPLKPDEAANVVPHPLFLLAPRSMTTQSLVRAADVSLPKPSTPVLQQDPTFRMEPPAKRPLRRE